MSNLSLLPPAMRFTVLDIIGTPGNGDSLAGQNVNEFPAGAVFYVRESNRFYTLRKNLNSAVVATPAENVVDGVGSSAAAGRFVACQQSGVATLSGGTITLSGFDLSRGGKFLCTTVTPGGTPGFLHAAKTADNIATITSSSGSDTSSVLIVFVEDAEAV